MSETITADARYAQWAAKMDALGTQWVANTEATASVYKANVSLLLGYLYERYNSSLSRIFDDADAARNDTDEKKSKPFQVCGISCTVDDASDAILLAIERYAPKYDPNILPLSRYFSSNLIKQCLLDVLRRQKPKGKPAKPKLPKAAELSAMNGAEYEKTLRSYLRQSESQRADISLGAVSENEDGEILSVEERLCADPEQRFASSAESAQKITDAHEFWEETTLALLVCTMNLRKHLSAAENPERWLYSGMCFAEKIKQLAQNVPNDTVYRRLCRHEQEIFEVAAKGYLDFFDEGEKDYTVLRLITAEMRRRSEVLFEDASLPEQRLAFSRDGWLPAAVPLAYLQTLGRTISAAAVSQQRTKYKNALQALYAPKKAAQ